MSCLFTCLRREPAEIKNNKNQLSQYGAASGACVDWFVCNNYIDDQINSFQSHYTSRGGLEYTFGLEAQFHCGGLQFVVNAFGQEGSMHACFYTQHSLPARSVALFVSP